MANAAIARPTLLSEPGVLYWAPLGSTLPTPVSTASAFTDTWPVAWVPLGPTLSGTDLTYTSTTSPVLVAEFLDPIKVATTGRTCNAAFQLASVTASNLSKVLNGATTVVTGSAGTTITKITPPAAGFETRCMIGFESLDSTLRWIGYQCINSGQIKLSFNKAPAYSDLPCTFEFEVPASGTTPVDFWTAGAARA